MLDNEIIYLFFTIVGDNIQTAVSVAKECGILSMQEFVIDVTVVMEENKLQPEIYFNAQEMSPKMVIFNSFEN